MPTTKRTDDAHLNHLFAAEFNHLEENFNPVRLALGEVIYESGEQLEYICFSTTAIILLLYILENSRVRAAPSSKPKNKVFQSNKLSRI